MGHSEMLLAVAGLDKKTILEQRCTLASGNWNRFAPSERAALSFARKLAKNASSVNTADMRQLMRYLGKERALDAVWWSCHCHYMTCVANALQLPLEQDNVFDGFKPRSNRK
jgi:alkylhydroperoxidase family enzyme